MKKSLRNYLSITILLFAISWQYGNGQTYYDLSSGSFTQDWSNTGLITTNDNWSGVPNIRGFLGDGDSGSPTGVDPQTLLNPLTNLDVIANQTNPNSSTAGGVAEFEITDPVVALQGSGTADYPYLSVYLNATGRTDIRVQYDLRDIDGSADNAIQQVALQYRKGNTGNFTNLPAGYIADASTGPSLATLVTHVDVTLPSDCNGQSQLEVRVITSNAVGNDEWIGIDNIAISSNADVTAPIPAFNPANSATDVLVWAKPAITFNEPVRKTTGDPLENSDLASLITFKKTDAGGADVPFTATIDAAKKVITVSPSTNLDNSQLYYLAVGAVEDISGNESTGSGVTFTTIASTTPVITITAPLGGETFFAGENTLIKWNSASIANVKIEAWVMGMSRTWKWETLAESTPASSGSFALIVPVDALYGTQYKIRVSDVTNAAVYSESNTFTCLAVATSITDLKARCIVNDIVKISSEVILTYHQAGSKDYYIQDAGAGILLYDSYTKLTVTYDQNDGITGILGTVATYNNILEIIPSTDPGAATSKSNIVTPVILDAATLNTSYETYESMLIKIKDGTFASAGSTFVVNTSYDLSDGSGTTKFYTKFTSANYLGGTIPSGTNNVIGICTPNGTVAQITSRSTSDFESTVGIENLSSGKDVTLYPVPASSVLNISNVRNLRSIEILDAAGKVVKTITTGTDELIQVPVDGLGNGVYMIRFNTTNGRMVKKFVKS